jgi:hypothetical protein
MWLADWGRPVERATILGDQVRVSGSSWDYGLQHGDKRQRDYFLHKPLPQ